MRIRLTDIAFDAGTQVRAAIDEAVVADYAERMSEGVQFPAVVLFHDGNRHYLGDGFHRYMASQRVGFVDIEADVRAGTKEDALWFALGANKANGHRMSDADKRHAVLLAVRTFLNSKSQHAIAQQTGCSQGFVSQVISRNNVGRPERVPGADGRSYPSSVSSRESIKSKATELLLEGKSVTEVRSVVGIGREAAYKIQREIGQAPSADKSKAAVAQRRKDIRDLAERGHTTRQIAVIVGVSEQTVGEIAKSEGVVIHADRVVGKTHRHDSNRIVEHMVMDAENLTADVNLIEFSDLDRGQIAGWLSSLQASRDKLGAFIRRLMKEQQTNEAA